MHYPFFERIDSNNLLPNPVSIIHRKKIYARIERVLCWHQVQSSEELEECVRKVKEAGLISERDERTIKQVKKGGKSKPCGALPRWPRESCKGLCTEFCKRRTTKILEKWCAGKRGNGALFHPWLEWAMFCFSILYPL